jgi:hypothetical protein
LQLRLPDLDQAAGQAWLADLLAYLPRRPGPTPRVEGQTVSQTEWASDGPTFLLIDHRHGADLTLHPAYDAAMAALVGYVRYWWADELPDEPEPANDEAAVARYFDRLEDEDYRIERAVLQPAADPKDSEPLRGRCQVCGRQLTNQGDGLWLHTWSNSSNCDPEDPEGPAATPTWQTPGCRRCGFSLSTDGTCTWTACPYADRQQYQPTTEEKEHGDAHRPLPGRDPHAGPA